MLAYIRPRWSTITFFISEHTNALRNSDSPYAIKSLEYEHGDVVAAMADELSEARATIASLSEQLERSQAQPTIRVVPAGNNVRAIGVGDQTFDASEQDALRQFVAESFAPGKRPTSRRAWVGQDAQNHFGRSIPQDTWEKIRRALIMVRLLVDDRPTVDARTALAMLFDLRPSNHPPTPGSSTGTAVNATQNRTAPHRTAG
jgi:hypothetical protein